MTPQSFTPAGVTALQAELNELSTEDLQTQVDAIQTDFRSWLGTNFSLTLAQQTFLASMDNQWMSYAGNVTGFAVKNHLTITLNIEPSSGTFKLIHIGDDIDCATSSTGMTVSGGVQFTVVYE